MTDFLLELRSEEIPARMQARAREDLARLFAAELAKAEIKAGALVTYATPRRLALIARDLPLETAAVSEETKGPRTSAPTQALEGFLRKTGLSQDQLEERDGVWFAVVSKPGRSTAEVLAEAIPAIVRAFPWPKSMRWGAASASTESLRWVRPLQGVVALLGEEVVPFEIAGIAGASAGKVGTGFPTADATVKSSAATLGHRFHHPGAITIGSAADYVEKLRACHVIVDQDERAALIRDGARALAADAGLELIEDDGLVSENAGLTEWPVPLLGRFDEAFLDVPAEVIQLTARVNQKYFVCRRSDGTLANAFICTANIDAADGGAKIVDGNRKVLAARLADAKFFYETDLKTRLEDQLPKLEKIVFHEKLGTVADKVDRVAKLARWLVEEGIVGGSSPATATSSVSAAKGIQTPDFAQEAPAPAPLDSRLRGNDEERAKLADMAERAARLCKADLVTGMVGEFPELQGVMGGYYAAAQGELAEVAEAIRDHYKPVGQGDAVPTAPVKVAVSLADKLDTVASFYLIGEKPTGSKDPFALRRGALGVLSILTEHQLRLPLEEAMDRAASLAEVYWKLPGFFHQPDQLNSALQNVHQAKDAWIRYSGPLSWSLWLDGLLSEWSVIPPKDSEAYFSKQVTAVTHELIRDLVGFHADRLKVQQREAGVRHDLIDAVFALGGEDDLVRLLARVKALQAFVGTEDGANLLIGYRRAANILRKEGWDDAQHTRHPGLDPGSRLSFGDEEEAGPRLGGRGDEELGYTPEPEEAALITALDAAAPAAAQAVAREDFEAAMAALATLRAPIDAFFDQVTVNDADPQKRTARLALLARIRDAVHSVADFSKIEG